AQCPVHWIPGDTPVGFDGYVYASAVMPNGDLVVGGNFTSAGGTGAVGVARWNGSSWSVVGGGIVGEVHSLLVMPNGDLIAGGWVSLAPQTVSAGVLRWDGT